MSKKKQLFQHMITFSLPSILQFKYLMLCRGCWCAATIQLIGTKPTLSLAELK